MERARIKVLSFSTYPLENPRHGGQIRSTAISECLRLANMRVAHLAIFDGTSHSIAEASDWNIALSADDVARIQHQGGRSDIDACVPILCDRVKLEAVLSLVAGFAPDVLLLQQPWLWPLAKICLSRLVHASVFYSSHNDEKSMLCESYRGDASATMFLQRAADIEDELVRYSQGLIAVSRSDAETVGRRALPSLVAPNGYQPQAERAADGCLEEKLDGKRYLIYVSSAHAPNIKGFKDLAMPLLAKLSDSCCIVVVGSICSVLPQDADRLILMGEISNAKIAWLFSKCAGIILPVTEGGGSNIKTAEALYWNRPVVATRFAMRGYESYLGCRHLSVSEAGEEFVTNCVRLLEQPNEPIVAIAGERRAALTWRETIKNVPAFLQGVIEQRCWWPERRALHLKSLELNGVIGIGWRQTAWFDKAVCSSGNTCSLLIPRDVRNASLMVGLDGRGEHIAALSISSAAERITDCVVDGDQPSRIEILGHASTGAPLREVFIEAYFLQDPAFMGQHAPADDGSLTIKLFEIMLQW